MSLLSRLLQKVNPSLKKDSGGVKTSGELIAEVTNGANLVEGKQAWELAEEKKDDLEYMKRCCDAGLIAMAVAGIVSAPYYFERVAILSRKQKNYHQEVEYCELYINSVESYYKAGNREHEADVRKGPTYKAIVGRLPKAKELLASKA